MPFNVTLSFPASLLKAQLSCLCEARLTLRVTRREAPAKGIQLLDDIQAISARVEPLVRPPKENIIQRAFGFFELRHTSLDCVVFGEACLTPELTGRDEPPK